MFSEDKKKNDRLVFLLSKKVIAVTRLKTRQVEVLFLALEEKAAQYWSSAALSLDRCYHYMPFAHIPRKSHKSEQNQSVLNMHESGLVFKGNSNSRTLLEMVRTGLSKHMEQEEESRNRM